MAVANIAEYLTELYADYIYTLAVQPQRILIEDSDKKQKVHSADNGTVAVTTFSNTTIFTVKLQWKIVSEADSGIIFDLWNDSSKANGREKTFYWEHPTDGNTYTVRFLSKLTRITANIPSYREISQVTLRIEGVKPSEV